MSNINKTVEGFLDEAIEASYGILEPDGRAIRDKIRRARTEIRERGENPQVRAMTSFEKNVVNHETDIGKLKERVRGLVNMERALDSRVTAINEQERDLRDRLTKLEQKFVRIFKSF